MHERLHNIYSKIVPTVARAPKATPRVSPRHRESYQLRTQRWIYCIAGATDSPAKIGSTSSLQQRLRDIQRVVADPTLRVVQTWDLGVIARLEAREIEMDLHSYIRRELAEPCHQTEWYPVLAPEACAAVTHVFKARRHWAVINENSRTRKSPWTAQWVAHSTAMSARSI